MTVFQRALYNEMKPGVWYDCYEGQGSGGAELPGWFHRNQTNALATLGPMVRAGALERRQRAGWPQVRRIEP